MNSAREIAEIFLNSESDIDDIIGAMEEYGRDRWNDALEWAAENAKSVEFECDGVTSIALIDKQSILKGKL